MAILLVKQYYRSVVDSVLNRIRKFDESHRLLDDLYTIKNVIVLIFLYAYYMLTSKLNFWYQFESMVSKNPDNLGLIYISPPVRKISEVKHVTETDFKIEKYTYKEIYEIILRLSYILAYEYHIQPDDVIGMAMHNKPIFVFYWLALWNIGAKPAFLNYNVNSNPLVHCIKVSEMDQIFIDETTKNQIYFDEKGAETATLQMIENQLPSVKLNFLVENEINERIKNPNSPKYRMDDNLRNPKDKPWSSGAYIFTSGTTGLPKAAIMSWRKISLGTPIYGKIVRIKNDSTVFTAMPLYHSTASALGALPTFRAGACLAITDKFSVSNFWYQIKFTNATHMQYVGEICRYLLNKPPNPQVEQDHRPLIAYGNGLRKDIWMNFKKRFNVYAVGEFFASTESPIATTSFQRGTFGIGACRNYGSIINFILSFQQRLVKMDSDNPDELFRDPKLNLCVQPKLNEPGQLLFRIVNAKKAYKDFQGYKNDHDSTNQKIVRDVFKKGDCWMKTGDLLVKDDYGLFYFVDRLGDTYRWKSENVSTNEVEIQLNMMNIFENSIVIGYKIDNYEGRSGYAILKPTNEILQDLAVKDGVIIYSDQLRSLLDKISTYCLQNLAKYSIPIFLKFVITYKTTDTFKIIKNYYKSEKFFENPANVNGGRDNELVFYFTGKSYEILTASAWQKIWNGEIKL